MSRHIDLVAGERNAFFPRVSLHTHPNKKTSLYSLGSIVSDELPLSVGALIATGYEEPSPRSGS